MTDIPSSEAQPTSEFRKNVSAFFAVLAGFMLVLTWLGSPYFTQPGLIITVVLGSIAMFAYPSQENSASAAGEYAASSPTPLPRSPEAERFWFWAILIGGIVGIALLNGFESDAIAGFGSLVVIATGTFMLSQMADVNVFRYIRTRGWRVALLAIAYIGLGLLYAGFRFGVHAHDWREHFDATKVQYETLAIAEIKSGGAPLAWTESGEYKYLMSTLPEFQNSKSRIARWAAFWPWSGAYFLLSDFLVRAFEWIIDQFGGVFDYIASRYTHDLK